MPYEQSNCVPQYEYTDEMYKEDYRIAKWCVYTKYPSKFPEKSITKEDLLQWCLLQLWRKRPLYDPSKGKYITWAITVCRRGVLQYPTIVRRQQQDAERDDLDFVLSADEHGNTFTRFDTVETFDKESTSDLIAIIYQAVDNIRTPVPRTKAKQVIDLFLSGRVKTLKQAGEIIGCTRERARQLVNKVRTHALQIVANGNTFSRQEYERQLAIIQHTPRPYISHNHIYLKKVNCKE